MQLTEQQKTEAVAKLKERGVNANCRSCGKNQWEIIEEPVIVGLLNPPPAIAIPTKVIPALGLICGNCGNVELFALGTLGLDAFYSGEKKL